MAKATTMGPMKIKESASYRVFKVFNAIILTLISVAMLYPFLYLVAQSFSSTEAIVAGEVGLIPKDFNISTYKSTTISAVSVRRLSTAPPSVSLKSSSPWGLTASARVTHRPRRSSWIWPTRWAF